MKHISKSFQVHMKDNQKLELSKQQNGCFCFMRFDLFSDLIYIWYNVYL